MATLARKPLFSASSSSSFPSLPSSISSTYISLLSYSVWKELVHSRGNRISCSISDPSGPSPKPPRVSSADVSPAATDSKAFVSRFAPDEPRKGADILVEALERQGVTDVFASPDGASMEIHQALTRSNIIRNDLSSHKQGAVFAAGEYARSSGIPGVCIATSGPGASNLVSGLADALRDGIPLIAITGQVHRRMIGTDAIQETPIVDITKHNYLVLDVDDIPRIVEEAFFLANSRRPGPVLIEVPKDIQQQLAIPNWDQPIKQAGYTVRPPKPTDRNLSEQIVRLILASKKPVLYLGDGFMNSGGELKRFAELTGIPVASTSEGLGIDLISNRDRLKMLGMHGIAYVNYAINKSDLLLACGVRCEDRMTGNLEASAIRAKLVYIDMDSAEIGKNKQPHVSAGADLTLPLKAINQILESKGIKDKVDFRDWREELNELNRKSPLTHKTYEKSPLTHKTHEKSPLTHKTYEKSPLTHKTHEKKKFQSALQVVEELTDGDEIVAAIGPHRMWTAVSNPRFAGWFKYDRSCNGDPNIVFSGSVIFVGLAMLYCSIFGRKK